MSRRSLFDQPRNRGKTPATEKIRKDPAVHVSLSFFTCQRAASEDAHTQTETEKQAVNRPSNLNLSGSGDVGLSRVNDEPYLGPPTSRVNPGQNQRKPENNPARQKTTHPTEAGQVTQKSREADQQSAAAPPSMEGYLVPPPRAVNTFDDAFSTAGRQGGHDPVQITAHSAA